MKYETILPTEASKPGGSDDYLLCIMYRMLFMYVHEYLLCRKQYPCNRELPILQAKQYVIYVRIMNQ